MTGPRIRTTFWMAMGAACLLCAPAVAATRTAKDDLGRAYVLTTPPRVNPEQTYWLVVGVHDRGGTGRGAAGAAALLAEGDCIVVGPTFGAGYETLPEAAEQQLDALIETLGRQYKLHAKVFLQGVGAGAEMVARYAMKHPERVAGCNVHGGSSFPEATPGAIRIPFFVGGGQSDSGYAAARRFVEHLRSRRFAVGPVRYSVLVLPLFYTGRTRIVRSPAAGIMREVYALATTGLLRSKAALVKQKVRLIEGMIRGKRFVDALRAIRALAVLPGPEALDAVRHAALAEKARNLLAALQAAATAHLNALPTGSDAAAELQAVLKAAEETDLAALQKAARSSVGILTPREPRKDGQQRVLFVGNSLTFGNRLPHLVQAMSDAKDARLIVGMDAIPAARLSVHWTRLDKGAGGDLRIEKDDWDTVILQDQSMAPAMDPKETERVGAALCEHLKAKGIATMFFLTWAYARSPKMLDDLAAGYFAAARKAKAPIAPVGYAWAAARQAHRAIQLHAADGVHSSVNGAYLAACVFLMSLTGQSPVGLPEKLYYVDAFADRHLLPAPKPDDARQLQAIAESVVRKFCQDHPDLAPPRAAGALSDKPPVGRPGSTDRRR